jgi:hypothetical protein
MKTKLIILAVCVCVIAAPAKASMFDFHFGSLTSSWDGTSAFSTSVHPLKTSGSVVRHRVPQSVANFLAGQWGLGGNFGLSMTITNITGTGTSADPFSAIGSGSFAIWDTTGDVIFGNVAGTWTRPSLPVPSPSNNFAGVISNVKFNNNSGDMMFDGHIGAASMAYPQPIPWRGSLIQLSTTGGWFSAGPYVTDSGSVDASVVPVPGAILLGMIGLTVAGVKLRKRA